MKTLLSRENFKTQCFKRDRNKCVFCDKDAVQKIFKEQGTIWIFYV